MVAFRYALPARAPNAPESSPPPSLGAEAENLHLGSAPGAPQRTDLPGLFDALAPSGRQDLPGPVVDDLQDFCSSANGVTPCPILLCSELRLFSEYPLPNHTAPINIQKPYAVLVNEKLHEWRSK